MPNFGGMHVIACALDFKEILTNSPAPTLFNQ